MKFKEEVKALLQTYLDANTTILAEVPSIEVQENYSNLIAGLGAYYTPRIMQNKEMNTVTMRNKLLSICNIARDLLLQCYKLQRKKATEMLAFVISDTDRIHDREHPSQITIAYALKAIP